MVISKFKLEETDKKADTRYCFAHCKDSGEFLEDVRISELLNKYCKFLPNLKLSLEQKLPTRRKEIFRKRQ